MSASTSRVVFYVLIVLSFFVIASRADRIFNIELKGIPPESYRNLSDVGIPDRVDWREKGVVTPVKNQGNFGKCFAFAIVAAIEGITTGASLSLSEQQLVDCSGCTGNIERAFKYVVDHGGLISAANYPYTGKAGPCRHDMPLAATISGYASVQQDSESALQKAVARQPVVARISAGHRTFREYKSGVYNSVFCGTNLDHAVTVVGYGVAGRDKYWLIKNSWGTGWGEGGYMRLKRDVGPAAGMCRIAAEPYYPTV